MMEVKQPYTVSDIYEYCADHDLPMFPTTYTSSTDPLNDFWEGYVDNHYALDMWFNMMYGSYRFFSQKDTDDISTVYNKMFFAVGMLLALKDKAYTQLFAIESMDAPLPFSDFDIRETRTVDKETDGTYVAGQRSDSSSSTNGQRTDTTTNQIMAYNSSQFADNSKTTDIYGSQTNSASVTKGSQTNTEDRNESTEVTSRIQGSKRNPNETLNSYVDTWNGYSFYKLIFTDICKEYLLV